MLEAVEVTMLPDVAGPVVLSQISRSAWAGVAIPTTKIPTIAAMGEIKILNRLNILDLHSE
jgi:hypothetical protein